MAHVGLKNFDEAIWLLDEYYSRTEPGTPVEIPPGSDGIGPYDLVQSWVRTVTMFQIHADVTAVSAVSAYAQAIMLLESFDATTMQLVVCIGNNQHPTFVRLMDFIDTTDGIPATLCRDTWHTHFDGEMARITRTLHHNGAWIPDPSAPRLT